MMIKRILFISLLLPTLLYSQHTIKATFTPVKDFTWAVLYKNSPTETRYVAQGRIIDGNLSLKLNEKATKGIYKLVYAVPQNEYNFDIIYNGEEDIELRFNLNDGAVFQKSTENILLNSYITEMASLVKNLESAYSNKQDSKTITAIIDRLKETQKTYEDKASGKIVSHFIKANKPYFPSKYEPVSEYIKNQSANYFKNIDFNNEVLQSSSLLLDKSFSYITGLENKGFTKQNNYNYNIDNVIAKTRIASPAFQKAFLDKLWQKLVAYELIESANYLSERHLIPLANQQNDKTLALKLTQFKNLSIGNPAPDFSLDDGSGKNLSELDIAENYILVFWSSGCSHCLKEIPQLYFLSQELNRTKYKVIAVGLEEDNRKWSMEVAKYPGFINVLKLNKWDNKVVNDYGLTSTPTYFILDQDKKFKVKPESFEDLKTYLKSRSY